jgi:UDP-N-acetylglucosamine/UDP-N-acetylgalactosamine diphosphorylase
MIKVSGQRDQINIAKVYKARQQHILRFWDELAYESRKKLLAQIDSIDFQLISRLAKGLGSGQTKRPVRVLGSAPVIRLPQTPREREARQAAVVEGEKAIREGRVAFLTVAGGQASRLGFDRPKGEFGIGPITRKSLFQLFAEKITALRKRYGVQLPWYIMTSESTDEPTREFFERHNHFSMPKSRTIFFKQRVLPAVDRRGKMLLAAKDEIFMSPDGHGGSLLALQESGSLDRIEEERNDLLFYFQVDNPLAVVADLTFIGHHVLKGAEVSCKGVRKTDPAEKVGVFASADGKTLVVEYSELSEENQQLQDKNGGLAYGFGNIAIHVFSLPFLKGVLAAEQKLPYHTSLRKVPYIDKTGHRAQPRKPNAHKFETFVFDALQFSEKTVVLEARREDEFAPVKSSTGKDTPENAIRLLSNMWGRWLAGSGVDVPFDENGNVKGAIEISPLYALDQAELARNVKPGTKFTGRLCLEP